MRLRILFAPFLLVILFAFMFLLSSTQLQAKGEVPLTAQAHSENIESEEVTSAVTVTEAANQAESTCDDSLVPNGVGDGAVSYTDLGITADYVRDAICAAYLRNEELLGNDRDNGNGHEVYWWGNYQVQDFDSKQSDLGAVIIFNPLVRAAFVVRDGIWQRYQTLGGVSSNLGGPITDEITLDKSDDIQGDQVSYFENGIITWSDTDNSDDELREFDHSSDQYPPHATAFLDVPNAHPSHRYINEVLKARLTQGCASNENGAFFCPEQFITREELALLVARSIYGPKLPSREYPFNDEVKSEGEFASAIALLRDDQIIANPQHGAFTPKSNITRGEAMTMIMRALMYPSEIPEPKGHISFADVTDDNPHKKAILVAAEFDIATGYSEPDSDDQLFHPNGSVTRGEVTEMLCHAFLSGVGICGSLAQQERGWTLVAPGIRWKARTNSETQNIALVDLQTPGINVELAHQFNDQNAGKFYLKNIFDLVEASGAKTSEPYPFVSINGTAFDCDDDDKIGTVSTKTWSHSSRFNPFPFEETFATSILGINGVPYGPELPHTDFHSVGAWWSGFFFYDADSNIASIHAPHRVKVENDKVIVTKERDYPYESPGFATRDLEDPNDRRRIDAQIYIKGKLNDSDFAVGYEKVILYNGENLVDDAADKAYDEHKTAIGISARDNDQARYLFLATAHADESLKKLAGDLKNAGAHYAILLDGSASSQFYSSGSNNSIHNGVEQGWFNGGCENWINPPTYRRVINSIVVYNDSIDLDIENQIGPSGRTILIDPSTEVEFTSDSFDDWVTLHYVLQPYSISKTPLQNIGVFYELVATYEDDRIADLQKPYTITISYDPLRLPDKVEESNLSFYFWSDRDNNWKRASSSEVNTSENYVTAVLDQLGSWAILAPASLEQLTTNSPSYAGPHDNPTKIIVRVTKPVHSLTEDDFSVTVGGIEAEIITSYEGSNEYVLEVWAPKQSADGLYDLKVSATAGDITVSDLEQDAVLHSESNNVDVMLVIDRSGSMGDFGYMEPAKDAAKQFVDFMFDNDQIGVASFSSSARVDFGLTPVTSGTDGSREQAKNTIDALVSEGYTSIGGGLQQGQNELTNKGIETHPWAIVLLSDGKQNRPPSVANVLPNVVATKTIVHTVALGPNSDQALMLDIASQTGGTYNLAPTGQQLQEVYRTIAGTVKGQQALLTQTGIVKTGETDEKIVVVDSTISEATFSVRWSNSASNLELELTAPDGTTINPTVAASTSDMVYVSGSTYAYYRIKSPSLSAGEWKMKITGGIISGSRAGIHSADPEEQYTAEVTGQPTGAAITINPYFDAGTTYETGDPILVSIMLSDDQPIVGAEVVAIVGPLLTGSSPSRNAPEEADPILLLYDDGAHADGQANDGVYANLLEGDNIETEGLYTFQIFATGTANNGETFARRTQQNVNVGVSPNPISANREADGLSLFLPLIMD